MHLSTTRPYKILLAASLIIPLILFSIMMWHDYKALLNENRNDAVRTVSIFQQHALNVFETHQLIADRINDRIKSLSWEEIEQSPELRTYLEKIEKEYPQITAIWLADPSGIVRSASQALPASPVSVADRDYFQALREKYSGLFIGHIVKPRVMKHLNFNVARRRGNSSEAFDGVIVVTVLPEYFSQFWNKVTSEKNSATVLLRSDGAVLARARGIDPDRLSLPPDSDPMKAIKGSDHGTYSAEAVHDGTRRIFAFQKVDKYNVYLIHGISMQSVAQEWRHHLVYYGGFFSVAIFILLLLALSVRRHAKNEQAAQEALHLKSIELEQAHVLTENKRRLLETVMEALPVSVAITDLKGGTIRSNSTFEQIWGGPRPTTESIDDYEAYRAWWFDTGIPVAPEEWASSRAVRKGETVIGQMIRIQPFQGAEKIVLNSASPVRDAEGNIVGSAVAIQDITELKQVEEELRQARDELEARVIQRTEELTKTLENLLSEMTHRERAEKLLRSLNRLYSVLSETNQTIIRVSDRSTLFAEFCRIAVEHGGFLLSWVGLTDQANGEVRVAAACGDTAYLDEIRISANNEPEGEGPTGIAIRQGMIYICNDFQNAPITSPWHEKGRIHGIRASASVALKVEGRVIGALTLYSGEKDFFDQQLEDLLVQLGADVSYALDNLEREARRQEAEQALREETLGRLRAVEELRKQEHILIQQSRHAAMGEMINNIAHQWRQPLNTLGLFTQRLGLFYATPRFNKEFLDTSVAKSMEVIQYMSRTIDDFRDFFSTDREKTDFRADEAVTKALSLVEASFKERGIEVEQEKREDVIINGYPNEYAQVLLNIFINARDAITERNIEQPWLRISIGAENGVSLVSIADNAGGIPEHIVGKIFDPYFTTKGPHQGTGVGLYMSKAIIENNMGGTLSVRNTDAGAEFRIEV